MPVFKTILFPLCAVFVFSTICWAAPLKKIDKIPPTGSIKINQDSLYTNSTRVTLNFSAQDDPQGSGLLGMKLSNDNKLWSRQLPYVTTCAWHLSFRDGVKQVYVKFCDKAKNWSVVYSAKITLDTKAPYFKVNSPRKFKNTNFQIFAGSKEAESAIRINNQEVIPANANATWYYEYPFLSAGNKISITAMDKAGNLASKKDFNLNSLDEFAIDPPRIFGFRFDPATRDFLFDIQDPPGVLSYNIYYANTLSGGLASSPFILAQGDYAVSGTGTTTWRDNGTYTGSHPSQVMMRFYKIEVNRVDTVNPIIVIFSPQDGEVIED